MTLNEVLQWLSENRKGKRVVLATGVFDLLHEEHIKFLERAKDVGDILVVGVETDLRVKQLKGENRPIWGQDKRVAELEKTKIADAVFLLPEQFSKSEDHEQLVAQIRPRFLAISSHTPHQEEKQRIIQKYDGELVIVHPHNPAVSTTIIVEGQRK
jgi:rfaE bifunctional protein nucleotidyltransferase chain/domain